MATSWNKIIDPPDEGVASARQSQYMMVDKVEALDRATLAFRLKFATNSFLPALADPFTWIYKKEILNRDPRWYEKNILGSEPLKFISYEMQAEYRGLSFDGWISRERLYCVRFFSAGPAGQSRGRAS